MCTRTRSASSLTICAPIPLTACSHGYFHVRAYRTDVQAVCDSLVFHSKLRKLSLYRDPIAWSDDRQILGEEINVYTNDSTLDSVYVERQALIVQQLPDTVTSTKYREICYRLTLPKGNFTKRV